MEANQRKPGALEVHHPGPNENYAEIFTYRSLSIRKQLIANHGRINNPCFSYLFIGDLGNHMQNLANAISR